MTMDDSILDRLFSGDLDKLTPLPKRVVRLFISSTFTDMTLERNSLMERVYPRLKKYCRERHGLDFQVVDMRWGVRDEATDDHQTVNLCSREILNCQRMSMGPNFVALLGDKYGFRPLCNRIKSNEYRALRRCLIELDISTDFLDTWYKEDLNAVPPEYLLQPISSILKNFTNKGEPSLQAIDHRIWQAIQERLHELLMIGSNRLVQQGRMSEQEQSMKYSISVTEREVIEGCIDLKDAKSHCLIYVRSIRDLQDHLDRCLSNLSLSNSDQPLDSLSPSQNSGNQQQQQKSESNLKLRKNSLARKASLKIGNDVISLTTSVAQTAAERRVEKTRKLIAKYIDLSSKNNIWSADEEAQLALSNLKQVKLENKLKLNRRNLTKYEVLWNDQEGISLKSDEHKHYLNELTEHFYSNMTRMIRKAAKYEQDFKTGLIGEVLQHSHYAKHVSKTFYGRNEELEKIQSYVLSSTESGFMPMFLYGVGGSGKTSVLAKAATLSKDWILRTRNLSTRKEDERWDQKPCIIMRFCGTTPNSSSIVGVLTSVCRQLQFNFYQYGPLNGAINQDAGKSILKPDSKNISSSSQETGGDSQPPCKPIPEDFVRLVFTFRKLLDNCQHRYHRERLFLIILDSVERLTSPAESSVEVKYSWLTSIVNLPSNVRLVVSCSSEKTLDSSNVDYKHLKRHFLQSYFNLVPLAELDKAPLSNKQNNHDSNNLIKRLNEHPPFKRKSIAQQISEQNVNYKENNVDRYKLLKRVLVPAVKLRLAPNKGIQTRSRSAETSHPPPSDQVVNHSDTLNTSYHTFTSGWSNSLPTANKRRVSSTSDLSQNSKAGSKLLKQSPPSILGDSNEFDLADESEQERLYYESKYMKQIDGNNSDKNIWIIHIKPLGVELALSVARRWLAQAGRNLTMQQWSIVEKSFSHCSRPIFVKLAFGEIINWKSYSLQSDSKGLTFGSSMLVNHHELLSIPSVTNNPALLKLIEDYNFGDTNLDDSFRWQILSMEQQWLNYLDYKQREQQNIVSEKASAYNSGTNGNLEDGSVVISVGASTITRSNGNSGGTSSPSSATTTNATSSMATVSMCHLSSTIDDAICQLFARIELQHGYILTKHSLSYITAARNGICENELEDILSLDDVVLDDVFQYHLPPVRRIPPLLWTRIRNDLPDYLSERDADGIVVNWHHNQFKQVTQMRYLSDHQQVFYIHSNMADYFIGKWADKAKPFRCTKQQIQMAAEQLESAVQQSIRDSQSITSASNARSSVYVSNRLSNGSVAVRSGVSFGGHRMRSSQYDQRFQLVQAKADRRVPHQPLFYTTNQSNLEMATSSSENFSGSDKNFDSSMILNNQTGSSYIQKRRYNLRKITELPYHLMQSGRFIDLANHVLFNYKWLYASIEALGLQYLLSDFSEALRVLEEALNVKLNNSTTTTGESSLSPSMIKFSQTEPDLEFRGVSLADDLDVDTLRSLINQLNILNSTIRLSCSAIHSDTQMLAPQLIGRLLPLIEHKRSKTRTILSGQSYNDNKSQSIMSNLNDFKYLVQLLDQCDKDGSLDCALLPTDHCLQSPDGLQLSSLEGHSFAIMSMAMAADQRHLLAVSNRFIMWDITTGEVSRDVDPKIDGSIMKQLKMAFNNEYAIVYTSNNVILVLDILTQEVIKHNHLIHDNSNNEEKGENILGLDLIDFYAGSRFVVWTKTKWFVYCILDDKSTRNKTGSMLQRVSIELEYSVDLKTKLDGDFDQILSVKVLDFDNNTNNAEGTQEDLIFIETKVTSDTVRLTSIKAFKKDLMTGWNTEIWGSHIDAAALCIDPLLKQLVYSDSLGNVYLSRRRNTCWSRGKLIKSNGGGAQLMTEIEEISGLGGRKNYKQIESVIEEEVRSSKGKISYTNYGYESLLSEMAPLCIELESNRSSLNYDPFQTKDGLKRIKLAKFERTIDGIGEKEEIEENCVFELEKLQFEEGEVVSSTTRGQVRQRKEGEKQKRKQQSNSLGFLYSGAIKLVKLYLNDRIVVLRVKSKNLSNGQQFKPERCLMLPKDIRSISVEVNRCQIKSIILGSESGGSSSDMESSEYLVAAVGRKLLFYSLDNEQFLRLIEAHSARIVQLIPILGPDNFEGKKTESNGMENIGETAITTTTSTITSPTSNLNSQSNLRVAIGHPLSIASASMDKTVKIWNLSNVNKDIHRLDKLENRIDLICLSQQRPLAACLARGELGIWDWPRLRLISRISQPDLISKMASKLELDINSADEPDINNKEIGGNSSERSNSVSNSSKIVRCKFSLNGRYLSLATLDSIHLLSLDGLADSPSTTRLRKEGEIVDDCFSATSFSTTPFLSQSKNNSQNHATNNAELSFKQVFKQPLSVVGLVRKLIFFLQDSRLLTIVECRSGSRVKKVGGEREQMTTQGSRRGVPGGRRQVSDETKVEARLEDTVIIEEDEDSDDQTNSTLDFQLARRLLILCNSVPDGRLLYTIDFNTPTLQPTNESHYLATNVRGGETAMGISNASRSSSLVLPGANSNPDDASNLLLKRSKLGTGNQIRLPIVTRDQVHIVTVENGQLESSSHVDQTVAAVGRSSGMVSSEQRRKSSAASKIPILLNCYATRDGLFVYSINLTRLELYNSPSLNKLKQASKDSIKQLTVLEEKHFPSTTNQQQQVFNVDAQRNLLVNISGDQFCRLKAVNYHERQTIVALIDDTKGSSYFIDIHSRQLVASSNLWNGKLSSDGRFGLSRMYKSSVLRDNHVIISSNYNSPQTSVSQGGPSGSVKSSTSSTSTSTSTSVGLSAGGLQLLEMRSCKPVKSLLTTETLAKLSANEPLQTTGSDADITCGFTKPNDSYVYFYEARLKRLLLVRISDSKLIANYKLSSPATKVKCSSDGFALILGLSDGSLTSLAIIDEQKSDTLIRLSQYPSRRK